MTDLLAQHCRFSEEYNAAYRIFSSATVESQRKASLRYCPGQTTTILISGFSFARSKKRAEDLRRRSSALGAGDRTRTGTLSPAVDFESTTSTNSITPALTLFIISDERPKFKRNLCFRRKIPDSAGRMAVPSCKERKIGVLCL